MVEIKIVGKDFEEVKAKAAAIFSQGMTFTSGYIQSVDSIPQLQQTGVFAPNAAKTPPPPDKRLPGRPRKDGLPPIQHKAAMGVDPETFGNAAHQMELPSNTAATAQPEPRWSPPSQPQAPAKEPTLEETKHAVNRVLESKGVKTAHECIKNFGANRITELPPTKWRDLINYCEGQL